MRGGGETVDAADLKSAGVVPRVGSNPTRPIDLEEGREAQQVIARLKRAIFIGQR
jgi:hypothetical protein